MAQVGPLTTGVASEPFFLKGRVCFEEFAAKKHLNMVVA
jgi:hypothetical protein